MRRAFKDLKASKDPQVTTFCLSNSNEVYIKTILEVRGASYSGTLHTPPTRVPPAC